MYRSLLLAALLATAQAAPAQTPAQAPAPDGAALYARKSLGATRLTGAKPTIDGRIDEALWQLTPVGSGFTQFAPNPGQPSTQNAEIRVAYDDDAIYVAARMFDTRPDSVVAQLARRDNEVYSDWIYVGLDSYYDRRTAFAFGLNPKGVKVDVLVFDDTNDDEGWDAVWDGAARQDSLGWTAEFRIPLSQLRFSSSVAAGSDVIWGVNFLRKIARSNEESWWSPIRPDANVMVSAFGDLTGIAGLEPPRRLEVMPYWSSRLVRAPGDADNPFYNANDAATGVGADLKVGVTSDLTLTATINPDFGQVEADPSEVNLTEYESFFEEKRPFFVEGFEIFQAGVGVGDDNDESLFYSRRIGRSPHGDLPDDAEYSDYPSSASILGAAKLSGKTRSGWSIGVLSAATQEEHADYVTGPGARGDVVVEPFTHYGMARVIRDFEKGQSAIGAVLTAVNRDEVENLSFLHTAAYAGGLNARRKFNKGNHQLSGFLMGSHVQGDAAAIDRTQRSSARYFQRPDNDHTDYDPTRTSLSGMAGGAEIFKTGGGHWRYATAVNVRSPGFEVNDLGFMTGTDQILQVAYVGYSMYKPSKRLNRWNVNVNQQARWTFGGEQNALGANVNGSMEFKNTASSWFGLNRDQQVWSQRALRGGPSIRVPGATGFHGGYDSNERKAFNWWLPVNVRYEDETDSRRIGFHPGVRLRASDQIELRMNPGVTFNRNAWQYVDDVNVNNATRYIFASLDQVTTSLTLRLSYTFTPSLSLQLYAEPFISAGQYTAFKEVADPRAERFADRFNTYTATQIAFDRDDNEYAIDRDGNGSTDFTIGNPDFNFRALRSNMVLRWEYRPGSSLFVVWSQGREASADYGDFDFSRDASRLFGARATNVLLVKASYWLGL